MDGKTGLMPDSLTEGWPKCQTFSCFGLLVVCNNITLMCDGVVLPFFLGWIIDALEQQPAVNIAK